MSHRGQFLSALAAGALLLGSTGLASAADPVEILFWDQQWGPPEYAETAQKLVDQWNTENPGIQVKYQSIPWTNWYEVYTTAISAGEAPDISTGAAYQPQQFAELGAIAPVDDVVTNWSANGVAEDLIPGILETLKTDMGYVALPWSYDVRVPFYRADLFAQAGVEPPTSWADLRSALEALKAKGIGGLGFSSDTFGWQILLSLMMNNGGGLFAADGPVSVVNDLNIETLTFVQDLVRDGLIHPASVGWTQDDMNRAFAAGDISVMWGTPNAYDNYPELGENVQPFSRLVGPHGDEGALRWTVPFMLYEQAENKAEAMAFMEWWTANNLPLWTEGNIGVMPALQSAYADPAFSDARVQTVKDAWAPVGRPTSAQRTDLFAELNEIEGEGVLVTLVQDTLSLQDPTAALQKAEDRINEIMAK
jgi:multiple sugar transport system substrate-binding protein